MSASPLDSTYGMWLVFLFIMSILYGVGILQAFLYSRWHRNDPRWVQALVVILVILETCQIAWYFDSTYHYFVVEFGNADAFAFSPWQNSAQLLAAYLSAFIVQGYFAVTIYLLKPEAWYATLMIGLLALGSMAAGLAQTVKTIQLASLTRLGETQDVTTTQAGLAFGCDLAITITLCATFNSFKTGIKSTNTLLNTLMIYAVNRGILTALCALLNLVLFLSLPGTFYFFIGLMPSSKLYMNTMLATLNTRSHLKKQAKWGEAKYLNTRQTLFPNGEIRMSIPAPARFKQPLNDGVSFDMAQISDMSQNPMSIHVQTQVSDTSGDESDSCASSPRKTQEDYVRGMV
ncbi:hypothetical protein BD626DRAFT_166801 [Schizophyllum amplum]|uniref:DUF6534 domain-containing protein n=1 Tax=Schizophyllum amplum TaxID=97359 RepID=A0A550CQ56_9AGAR|nr:hypothetical protein BD626DRAFT_166801 [Auriculariopsis ampla]